PARPAAEGWGGGKTCPPFTGNQNSSPPGLPYKCPAGPCPLPAGPEAPPPKKPWPAPWAENPKTKKTLNHNPHPSKTIERDLGAGSRRKVRARARTGTGTRPGAPPQATGTAARAKGPRAGRGTRGREDEGPVARGSPCQLRWTVPTGELSTGGRTQEGPAGS